MDSFEVGRCSYRILCVSSLCFREIYKEEGTRGLLYAAWACHNAAFVAQSVPPLTKMIFQVSGKRVYSSSFYRILRKVSQKGHTKGFHIEKLASVQELNEVLSKFDMLFVCSMDFEKWVVDETSVQKETKRQPEWG
jgi:hypothetical protein